jgi:hypothetical protein
MGKIGLRGGFPRGQSKTSDDDSPTAPQSSLENFFSRKISRMIHTSK